MEYESELQLDFDGIERADSVETSFGDLYGYSVFSVDFKEKIQSVKKTEKMS